MPSPADEYELRLTGSWNDIQDHMAYLHQVVLRYPSAQVIELGTRGGNSTSALLSAVQIVGGHLWSCDIEPLGRGPGWDFPPEWLGLPEWTFIVGDSASDAVLEQMPAEADVIFADTSHTFEQTLAELNAYMPRLKPGGVLLQHDTQCVPDLNSGREFRATKEVEGPVADAMDAYCTVTGMTWRNRHSEITFYGLGILEKPRR